MEVAASRWWLVIGMLCASGICGSAVAQDVQGSLIDLMNSGRFEFNRLERQAALANQAAYNALAPVCGGQGETSCSVEQSRVFANVRELVQTANEMLGTGATEHSLGLDEEGLGFALRWTAAEEMAAQSSAGSEFANNQLTSLMSRMTALRYGARGFSVVNAPHGARDDGAILAHERTPLGGGAAADVDSSSSSEFSRWGGFLDGSFGWGDRDPTDVEDAFDFDGMEVTAGVDYRFTPAFVLGAIAGHTEQEIDFDSRRSVVDGGIESDGFSLIVYGLHEWDGPYMSASLGWQRLSLDMTRRITYPSFNPDTESTDVTARGSTDSTTFSATFNSGWAFGWKAFGAEPYMRAEYRDMKLDDFAENSVYNSGSLAGQAAGFDFAFGDQHIKSFDTALGFRVQYALTPSFGVIVPYLKAELHWQLENDPHAVDATYENMGGVTPAAPFDIVGDESDDSFYVAAVGFSVVLKGGWQGFIQYQTVQSLDLLSNDVITGGVRSEF
jgi:outer membrane autotransporter protein